MSIAQVIKLKTSGDQFTYFLHYMGWNSRWDKWVVESDLMAAGPEALEMQKQLKDKKKKQKVGQRQRKHAFPACAWGTVFGIGMKQRARLETRLAAGVELLRNGVGFVLADGTTMMHIIGTTAIALQSRACRIGTGHSTVGSFQFRVGLILFEVLFHQLFSRSARWIECFSDRCQQQSERRIKRPRSRTRRRTRR